MDKFSVPDTKMMGTEKNPDLRHPVFVSPLLFLNLILTVPFLLLFSVPQIYRPPPTSSIPSKDTSLPSSNLEIEPKKPEQAKVTQQRLSAENNLESNDVVDSASKVVDVKDDENATPLPEGFFDDPVQDAKVKGLLH